ARWRASFLLEECDLVLAGFAATVSAHITVETHTAVDADTVVAWAAGAAVSDAAVVLPKRFTTIGADSRTGFTLVQLAAWPVLLNMQGAQIRAEHLAERVRHRASPSGGRYGHNVGTCHQGRCRDRTRAAAPRTGHGGHPGRCDGRR